MPHSHDVIVIGAGPAGLASAACLKQAGLRPLVFERSENVGSSWRGHYDRLHLHTNNRLSHLPGLRFPDGVGRYPSRREVVDYLDRYAQHHRLDVRFGANVVSAKQIEGMWQVETDADVLTAANVVIATGYTGRPFRPAWEGSEQFPGPLLHSSEYKSGERFRGQRVLVVGLGNSGGEIALDLAEHGAKPTISVRSPVNIIPREILGVPILAIALPLSYLPPGLADALSAPLLALAIGSYRSLGLKKRAKGPFRQIAEDGRVPLIDTGTVRLIRRGGAHAKPEIVRFSGSEVSFNDGTSEPFDGVIAATGFRPAFDQFLETDRPVTDDYGLPLTSGRPTGIPGLYFCGFYLAPTGMLREVGLEAQRIAKTIAGGGG